MVEAHVRAGRIRIVDNPAHLIKPLVTAARNDFRPENTSDGHAETPSNGGSALERFTVSYGHPEDRRPTEVTLGLGKPLTKPVTHALTLQYLHARAETRSSRQSIVASSWHDRRSYSSPESDRAAAHGSRARHLTSSDRADGPAYAPFADLLDQSDRRIESRKPFADSDKDGRWDAGENPSFTTSTNAYAKEAVAAVADELERLRTAIRRSIDDLERVRGSVQTPLPSLPPNRGAFRIS